MLSKRAFLKSFFHFGVMILFIFRSNIVYLIISKTITREVYTTGIGNSLNPYKK